jgi:hypothetical protein
VVSDVRTSIRLEGKTKGLKCDACNLGKDRFCCLVEPLNLSEKAIRGLGKDFCKIPAAKMSVEGLQEKLLLAFLGHRIICKRTDTNCSLHPGIFQGIECIGKQ